jgi:hypothetical protein
VARLESFAFFVAAMAVVRGAGTAARAEDAIQAAIFDKLLW